MTLKSCLVIFNFGPNSSLDIPDTIPLEYPISTYSLNQSDDLTSLNDLIFSSYFSNFKLSTSNFKNSALDIFALGSKFPLALPDNIFSSVKVPIALSAQLGISFISLKLSFKISSISSWLNSTNSASLGSSISGSSFGSSGLFSGITGFIGVPGSIGLLGSRGVSGSSGISLIIFIFPEVNSFTICPVELLKLISINKESSSKSFPTIHVPLYLPNNDAQVLATD